MLPFCSDIAAVARPNTIAEHTITRRMPKRSIMAPTMGLTTASPNIDAAYDRDACERPQPNSAASGLTKTPAVALNKGAYPANIPRAAPRITLT
jgi:hypothetical protein